MQSTDQFCEVCGSGPLHQTSVVSSGAYFPEASGFAFPESRTVVDVAPISPARRRTSRLLIVAPSILASAAVIIAVVVLFPRAQQYRTITVNTTYYTAGCSDLSSGSPVYDGSLVQVRSANHHALGTGVLQNGSTSNAYAKDGEWVPTCTWNSKVRVPVGPSVLVVHYPGGSSSGIAFGIGELKRNHWVAGVEFNYDTKSSSYTDGYNYGYQDATSLSECDWYLYGQSYDSPTNWNLGCDAGYQANP